MIAAALLHPGGSELWFYAARLRVKAKQIDYGIDPSRIIPLSSVKGCETWTDPKLSFLFGCSYLLTVILVTI